MTTQFLSRVDREIRGDSFPNVGPGAYSVAGGAMSKSLPGFVPFSTSSRRKGPGELGVSMGSDTPPPGSYNIAEDPLKKPGVSSVFKSTAQRFKDLSVNPEPGPGDYVLKSLMGKPVQKFARPKNNPLALIPHKPVAAPSIPAKSQSHGYEVLPGGIVQPQAPLIPGYSGNPGDTVGPADYNPRVDVKFRHQGTSHFARSTDTRALDKILTKASSAPGPGYYDTPSSFDLLLNGQGANEMDFLVHLRNAKRKQTSSFESKTVRDSLMKEIRERKQLPGPGEYELPSSIKVATKPPELQFFTSSDERFKDTKSRSMRITVAPGDYNPITSEFDLKRLKILKQKKMASRSDWAQNIAFTSTESRFRENNTVSDVPPATAYYPKTTIADSIKQPNVRSGPFGSTEQRFREPKPPSAYECKEKIIERELNRELQQFLSKPNDLEEMRDNRSPRRPKYTSSFAPSPESRLRPVKSPPVPAPGSYDTTPKWDTGAPVMAPPLGISKKKHDPRPGPGQYNVDPGMGANIRRNPKNIMISTTKREEKMVVSIAPGPGVYNVSTSLHRPSHNILLSDKYR